MAWTPDGKILYTDPAAGFRNIWRMDSNGVNSQALTSSPIDKDDPSITSDGGYISSWPYKQLAAAARFAAIEPKRELAEVGTQRHFCS